ncbi:PP2C family protein-serine/threonine phosphatase [Streptomyces cavernicola]|uniref:PP2C family protein-serine/threonine phosphatase n=1 Tax=Streptomyces cavernicola TaxID=3043613 RepID=A0ABT6S4V4_9ACTN|nr:PP2C family protein-serine/threonine phosphatase [Streptomyces sp. B-S-A6]MDI3403122.1 PP2C family protein-serine/threonine phosphatase [Streptomyces sp. B-S-A6]
MTGQADRRRHAESRGGGQGAWLRRGASPPSWARVLPPLLLAVLGAVQALTPPEIELGLLLAATPPLAALTYGPIATGFMGLAAVVLVTLPGTGPAQPGNSDILMVAFVAVLSVGISWVRSRRDAQLVSVRSVAEAAQLAVLPPLTEHVGRVRCAGLYRAAERGTLVGGDLYDVREGPWGVRALVGDVQGHGLAAVGTVAALLGAFREAVLDEPHLEGLAAKLDRRLVTDNARTDHAELFATALLVEFAPGARTVRVLTCGHPPPLLLRAGVAEELAPEPGTPLGLGLSGYAPPRPLHLDLAPGDRLLAHTDGVSEARDAQGALYVPVHRFAALPIEVREGDPAVLVGALWRDLRGFAGEVQDDVALLLLAPMETDPESGT